MKISTVIFDLDGTLIDSESVASIVAKKLFKKMNIELSPLDSHFITGRTWEEGFDYLFKRYPLPLKRASMEREIRHRYHLSLKKKLKVVTGAKRAVQALAKEFELALVSGSSRKEVEWALEKLRIKPCFKVILGAEDYPRSKPNPDGFLKAISMLNVAPSHTVVFEDSTAGIDSAIAAGLWVIAITSTNHFNQDQTRAHLRIEDFSKVSSFWLMKRMEKIKKTGKIRKKS